MRILRHRKRVETDLREGQERLHKLAGEACFEGIIIHDGERILEANQQYAEMNGYQRNDIIGMNTRDTIAPEFRDKVLEYVRDGYEQPYDALGLRQDASTFPIEIHAGKYPLRVKGRAAAVWDMSEYMKTLASLRREEENFRRIASETPAPGTNVEQ